MQLYSTRSVFDGDVIFIVCMYMPVFNDYIPAVLMSSVIQHFYLSRLKQLQIACRVQTHCMRKSADCASICDMIHVCSTFCETDTTIHNKIGRRIHKKIMNGRIYFKRQTGNNSIVSISSVSVHCRQFNNGIC